MLLLPWRKQWNVTKLKPMIDSLHGPYVK
jgi:hypothetical protein